MQDDWRAAFPTGCRVEVDAEAFMQRHGRWQDPRLPPRLPTGTVTAHGRHRAVWVVLDNRRSGEMWRIELLRRLEPAP